MLVINSHYLFKYTYTVYYLSYLYTTVYMSTISQSVEQSTIMLVKISAIFYVSEKNVIFLICCSAVKITTALGIVVT